MMIDSEHFVTHTDYKEYQSIIHQWDTIISNNKTLKDKEMEEQLQRVINELKDDNVLYLPRLNSITDDEKDYLELSKVSYSSTEDKFTLKLLFESDKSEGKFTYTFDKEG